MASVKACAPAAGAVSIYAVADLLAGRTGAADDRPVAARRVDAWIDIAEQLLTYGRVDLTGLLDETDDADDPDDAAHESAKSDPAHDLNTGRGNRRPDRTAPDRTCPTDDAEPAAAGTNPNKSGATDSVGTAGSSNPSAFFADPADTNSCSTGSDVNDPVDTTDNSNASATTDPAGADSSSNGFGVAGPADADPTGERDDWEPVEPIVAFAESDNGGPIDDLPADSDDTAHPASTAPAVDADPPSGSTEEAPNPGDRCSCGAAKYPPPQNPATPPRSRWASRRSRLPHLVITMSASTWAGLDKLPAHLDGYGAVTAETAMALARSAKSITAAVVDSTNGTVIGVGDRVYRPRQAVRDSVTTAAETCRFPSCRQPAWRCDLDHRDEFDHQQPHRGGRTGTDNLDPLCRAHHLLKHHTAWSSTPTADGYGREWVSPTGHHYLDPPRSFTLPEEQLTPTGDVAGQRDQQAHEAEERPIADDDFDPRSPDRGDWRDAEFGGAFPNTLKLRGLHAIARRRLWALRDPRPPAGPVTPSGARGPDYFPPGRKLSESGQPEPTEQSDDPPF